MADGLWKTKLAAWVHDPAEKALILLRDKTGHEGGTVRQLREALGLSSAMLDKRADWWAAAADRPQWPQETNGYYQSWCQVDFTRDPMLIHPLSGTQIDFGREQLAISPEHIKTISLDHFQELIMENDAGEIDHELTFLAFWRFGPETPAPGLRSLWQVLPADTRVPDHSIWQHLDLVSAFAGAFAHGESPALFTISFGPVQGFIQQARTTSDLWAGSHLLSHIAWEGMKVVCETCGPDAILFPSLRGVPLVDLWLLKKARERGMEEKWKTHFKNIEVEWLENASDANPLFSAALPNKFVAIVPEGRVQKLADSILEHVRGWMKEQAFKTLDMLYNESNMQDDQAIARKQIKVQLEEFPEIHWAAVPWYRINQDKEEGKVTCLELVEALQVMYPQTSAAPGFLGSDAWKVLSGGVALPDGTWFFKPKEGVLYPALYDLLDRVTSASKATRAFSQIRQEGYRCTLCGEREWLTLDREQLEMGKDRRGHTLWSRVAQDHRSWAKEGEYLCALCATKRLWPTLFTKRIQEFLEGQHLARFVVSTHTMALSTSIARTLNQLETFTEAQRECLRQISLQVQSEQRVAFPLNLHRKMEEKKGVNSDFVKVAYRLPGWLDSLQDQVESETAPPQAEQQLERIHDDIMKTLFGHKPEAYYATILLDGDHMGAWVAGNEERHQLAYLQTWHKQIQNVIHENAWDQQPDLSKYLHAKRWASPARHAALSSALNNFSLHMVRHIVEVCFKGKLIYSGGDDVLALMCVDDLLPAMLLLRLAYSGLPISDTEWRDLLHQPSKRFQFQMDNGYLRLHKRILRILLTMGEKATASIGAIVAHHQAPLQMVLRELREAEKEAKSAGRNAFCVRILKRAGGEVGVTAQWWPSDDDQNKNAAPDLPTSSMGLLIRLTQLLADPTFSRRAVYLAQLWLNQLPEEQQFPVKGEIYWSMLSQTLTHQFKQQGQGLKAEAREQLIQVVEDLIAHVRLAHGRDNPVKHVEDFLVTAEFLARESRAFAPEES